MTNVPLSVDNSQNDSIKMSAAFARKDEMKERAKKEGAKIIEVPLPDAPGATRHGGIPAEAVGQMASIISERADDIRKANPKLTDEVVRTMIVVHGGENVEKFIKKYPAIFHTFTARETNGEVRGRMMQVIKLKMQLEKGNITPDDSHCLLADLFGVNAQQREELRKSLQDINEKKNNHT